MCLEPQDPGAVLTLQLQLQCAERRRRIEMIKPATCALVDSISICRGKGAAVLKTVVGSAPCSRYGGDTFMLTAHGKRGKAKLLLQAGAGSICTNRSTMPYCVRESRPASTPSMEAPIRRANDELDNGDLILSATWRQARLTQQR